MTSTQLSIVIPAYNESSRLPSTLQAVLAYLGRRATSFEVIVVDDGSVDETARVASEYLRPLGEDGRVLRNRSNRGKGASVRLGMLAARGDRVLFTDADLSTPIEDLTLLEAALDRGAAVAIGSRAIDRTRIEKPQVWLRDRIGRLFNIIVRSTVLPGIHDTQCGFKLFARECVRPIFCRQRLDGFGFDVEVLAVAKKLGFATSEVSVRWANVPKSRVTLLRGAITFLDPFRIKLGILLGRYETSATSDQLAVEEVIEPDARLPVSARGS